MERALHTEMKKSSNIQFVNLKCSVMNQELNIILLPKQNKILY